MKSQQNKDQKNETGFKWFPYLLAWIAFISSVGSVVSDALQDHKPPTKDDYYK